MAAVFAQTLPFDPSNPAATLSAVPARAAVFALHFGENREPYLAHTTQLRRRLDRVLAPQGALSRRLNLLPLVQSISWTPVGSRFESDLVFYRVCDDVYGRESARKRLRLRPPAFLRLSASNAYPRLYASNKLSRAALSSSFGPFPSRLAADRTLEAVLDLFQLRRCYEDLAPYPEHPGCAYGDMKKCLAPCKQGCSDTRYAAEAGAVFSFLETRGRSLLTTLEGERDTASEELRFEAAAALHQRVEKAAAVAAELPEAVHRLSELAAIIVQPSDEPGTMALFSLVRGMLTGPALFSTLGMRLHNEQSGSSSLFSHPVALQPVPLEAVGVPAAASSPDVLEMRLAACLATLHMDGAHADTSSLQDREDHLALFTRWCYRPHTRRTGEVLFASSSGDEIPSKALLRAISRVAREAAPAAAIA